MANEIDALVQALQGTAAGTQGTSTQTTQQPQFGPDQLAIFLGQLAGAVGEGKTLGSNLGQVGVQQGQSNIAASAEDANQKQLLEMIQQLTGQGVNTTAVKVGEDGQLQVTGTAAPRVEGVPNQPVTQGEQQSQTQVQAPIPKLKPLQDR